MQNAISDDKSRPILVARLQSAPDRRWANAYFDLLARLISAINIDADDPRFVTSLPNSHWFLPVTINYRYVLAVDRPARTRQVLLIYGPEYEGQADLQEIFPLAWRYKPLAWAKESIETPFMVIVDDIFSILTDENLLDGWLSAARREMKRVKRSPFRKFHQPIVFLSAVDPAFREGVLFEAFQATHTE